MTERNNRDTSADSPGADHDIGSDTGVLPGDNASDGFHVRTFVIDGETVLFDIEDHQRWLQSDSAVVLTEAV